MRLPAILIFTLLLLTGCTGIPEGLTVVDGFELPRYLGTWHEIARLDHSFERGLSDIRAEYSLREDGGVKVLNSGFDAETQQRRSAEGKAYFIDGPERGRLKVSFFGPFYGATTSSRWTRLTTNMRWSPARTETIYGFWHARRIWRSDAGQSG